MYKKQIYKKRVVRQAGRLRGLVRRQGRDGVVACSR